MPATTTAYLSDGRRVDVPKIDVDAWQEEVQDGDTTLGLGDWYTYEGDEHQDKIQGSADTGTRCDHDELSHRVVNESQTGDGVNKDAPLRIVRVCHRRACILDALAYVERGTGEHAAWAGPGQQYTFEVPKEIPERIPAAQVATPKSSEENFCEGQMPLPFPLDGTIV